MNYFQVPLMRNGLLSAFIRGMS